ncbi:hypothetical protein CBR_g19245 [Chara braunii]|uniref:Uncharacterized protein n=1 Tax=Chara braunii TaxID=69332 RepID=A0A388JTM5_CHABU|nr:hypothetical protein CBR_g19245 [Chara braunii]|eukprot:GBG61169.1 hypothetical protein CBR_g19245 [Chara braunii]
MTIDDSAWAESASTWQLKLVAVAAIILISLVCSFLPLKLRHLSDLTRSLIINLSSYFTAGVFLGVGLLHMLPEAAAELDKDNLHISYAICALGIVVIWFLERHMLRDSQRLMAVAAGAEHRGGASICYVHVHPVSSYGIDGQRGSEDDKSALPGRHRHALCKLHRSISEPPSLSEPLLISVHKDGPPFKPSDAWQQHEEESSPTGDWRLNGVLNTMNSPLEESVSVSTEHCIQCLDEENQTALRQSRPPHDCTVPECGSGGALPSGFPLPPVACEPHDHYLHAGKWKERAAPAAGELVLASGSTDVYSSLHDHLHAAHHQHVVLKGEGMMSYVLATMFSFHSFVVGVAFGSGGAISLLIALLAHKGAEAFAVGVQFVREDVPLRKAVPVIILYCSMTPLGVFAGMMESVVKGQAGVIVTNVTQAVGAGSQCISLSDMPQVVSELVR